MIFKKNFYSTIEIRNILGFNQFAMNTGKKQENSDMDENVPLYLNNVDFAFYLNKTLITKEMCKYENFRNTNINFFWPIKIVYFYDVYYSMPICPYVFLNTQIKQVVLYQIMNSFIFKNRLEFTKIDEDNLNIRKLTHLDINIGFEILSGDIICPHIFKGITNLVVKGSSYSIQTNLFEDLTKIKYTSFDLDSLKNFLHQRAALNGCCI